MSAVIDRQLIVISCFAALIMTQPDMGCVLGILVMVIAACCGIYFRDKRIMAGVMIVYIVIMHLNMYYVFLLPLAAYELCDIYIYIKKRNESAGNILIAVGALLLAETVIFLSSELSWNYIVVTVLMTLAAVVIFTYDYLYNVKKQELITTVDNSNELNMALEAKNRYLIENQDAQIMLATLKERNRIAREIHDNVGHMLSRSILQTGAILAVNKDENLTPIVEGLKTTLDSAMTSIRNSVHDLHDDSIDLSNSLREIINTLSNYNVKYEYDMNEDIPKNIKYCIISVVKEAVSNIIKHSNATEVSIVLREHPAFYQMLIEDNGKVENAAKAFGTEVADKGSSTAADSSGIGLIGMRERIASFNGTIDISKRTSGFRIFINIPKAKRTK